MITTYFSIVCGSSLFVLACCLASAIGHSRKGQVLFRLRK